MFVGPRASACPKDRDVDQRLHVRGLAERAMTQESCDRDSVHAKSGLPTAAGTRLVQQLTRHDQYAAMQIALAAGTAAKMTALPHQIGQPVSDREPAVGPSECQTEGTRGDQQQPAPECHRVKAPARL